MDYEDKLQINNFLKVIRRRFQFTKDQQKKNNSKERNGKEQILRELAKQKRYNNVELIEQEKKKLVPILDLTLSPLLQRRKRINNSQYLDGFLEPWLQHKKTHSLNLRQTQIDNFLTYQNNNSTPQQKSQYVTEVNKQQLKEQSKLKEESYKQRKIKGKELFKSYNRYKILTSE